MDASRVDMFVMTNQKYLPAEKIVFVKEKLKNIDEERFALVSAVEFKDPTTILLVSIFLGTLGIDRFMLGETGMGILKLLTCGLCGILTIVDWFTVQKKAKEINFNKLMTIRPLPKGDGLLPVSKGYRSAGRFPIPSLFDDNRRIFSCRKFCANFVDIFGKMRIIYIRMDTQKCMKNVESDSLAGIRGRKVIVGAKQLKKALAAGQADQVFLAENADPALTEPIEALCREYGVACAWVASMADLGRACGIDVGAAAAAVAK